MWRIDITVETMWVGGLVLLGVGLALEGAHLLWRWVKRRKGGRRGGR